MLQYCFCCFKFWFFGCEAYGILVPWLGIKPSPPVLKVQSLNHWIPREVPCHVHFWTSHSPQHRAWHTAVVQEKSRKPFTLCAMTFLSPKRWIVSQHFLNWRIIDLQYCVNFCYTANISQRNFNFLRNEALPKTSETAWLKVIRVLFFSSISEFLTWNMMASANLQTCKTHK